MSATVDSKKNIDTDDYFLLVARVWNSKIEDYSAIEDSATSAQYFDNYPDAEESFKDEGSFPELKGKDIKLELIHVRFGVNRLIMSRILI